jgi:hypothetical protein
VAGSWGGHCIPLWGYDSNQLWCVTWGALQSITWQFFTTYCDEAFVLLATDWIAASGQAPSHLAWASYSPTSRISDPAAKADQSGGVLRRLRTQAPDRSP